jgi:hypothetical protein
MAHDIEVVAGKHVTQPPGRGTKARDYLHGVVAVHALVPASLAEVVVTAHIASEALAGVNLRVTVIARACESRLGGVVQMVQNHHAAVAGPAEGVKLVVVSLAQRQEGLEQAQGTRQNCRDTRIRCCTLMPDTQRRMTKWPAHAF